MSTPVPEPTPADKMRASDADRQKIVDRLQEAFSEGRLDLAELDERTAGAYAAKTLGDLKEFTRDLPPAGTKPAPAPPAATTGSTSGSNDIVSRIKRGVDELPGWVLPVAGVVVLVNLIGLVAGLVGNSVHSFAPLWILLVIVWVAGGRSLHHNRERDRDRNRRRPPDRWRGPDNDWYDRYHRRSRDHYDQRYRRDRDDDTDS